MPTPKVGLIPGTRKVQSGPQYGSMEDVEEADPFLADLFETCKAQNIPAGATLKEFSPGQFEINLHHVANAELAADHGVLLKRAVKAVARKHGMAASFMAKPFAEWAGCSMHVHISLVDAAGKNMFAGTGRDGPFADTLRHAIGGLAKAMPESMAIFAPTANSYRRYRPGVFVPLEPNWGRNHRGVALRIPMSGVEDTRVEHRPGGSDGNPYLVIAAILAGVHHGIANKVEPGPMVGPGIDHRREGRAAGALVSGARCVRRREDLAEVSRGEIPQAVRDLPARGGRAVPLGNQRPRLRVVSQGGLTYVSAETSPALRSIRH